VPSDQELLASRRGQLEYLGFQCGQHRDYAGRRVAHADHDDPTNLENVFGFDLRHPSTVKARP
jgi:hypothetical protein